MTHRATMRLFRERSGTLALVFYLASGCSATDDGNAGPNTGAGGQIGSGGARPTGGSSNAGGNATGGFSATGGSTGGTPGMGGGNAATGGAMGGGTSPDGGTESGGASSDGGAPAAGGASTGGTESLELPIERAEDNYVLEFGETLFAVDPTRGARIVQFAYAGSNLLLPVELMEGPFLNGGSTLWLSPQTAWDADPETDWPPPEAIDTAPYAASVEGEAIVTIGEPATLGDFEFSVTKRFAADLAAQAIDITYTMINEGTAAASFAPWEVSRHVRGGLTFWPGTEVESGEFPLGAPIDGVIWWDDSVATETDMGKVFSDGSEGWLAHVQGDLLLVKTWTDSTMLPPAHGEIELFLGDGYIEIEEHGPYGEVQPEEQSPWNIRWMVRPLDAEVDTSVGSEDLLRLARELAL